MHTCLRTLARHAEWANGLLYESCLQLTRERYHASSVEGASVHDSLNRMLIFMRVMQARLDGYEAGLAAHEGEQHKTFSRMRDALVAEDVAVLERIRHLGDEELQLPVSYVDDEGEVHTSSYGDLALELLLGEAELRGRLQERLETESVFIPDLSFTAFVRAST